MKVFLKQLVLVVSILLGIDAQASIPLNWIVNPSNFGFDVALSRFMK